MYLILKCDLIHLYLDKSKTRILGRREYFMNSNATFQEGIFASVTCVMDIACNPSALMPLRTCSSVFVHSFLCVYVVIYGVKYRESSYISEMEVVIKYLVSD